MESPFSQYLNLTHSFSSLLYSARKFIPTIFGEREGLWTCFSFSLGYSALVIQPTGWITMLVMNLKKMIIEGKFKLAPKEASNNYK